MQRTNLTSNRMRSKEKPIDELGPQGKGTSFKLASKAIPLARIGKKRQNTSLLHKKVSERFKSFKSDYDKFLQSLCYSILLNPSAISTFAQSQSALEVRKLIHGNTLSLDPYKNLFTENVELIGILFAPLLECMLASFFDLKAIQDKESFLSLELVGLVRRIVGALQDSKFLVIDTHATQIMSWWLPQFLEVASCCLLLSEPSPSGTDQHLTTETKPDFLLFIEVLEMNTSIAIFLLFGSYLSDNPLLPIMQVEDHDMNFLECVDEKVAYISNLVRICVQDGECVESCEEKRPKRLTTWHSIQMKLPDSLSITLQPFMRCIPEELRNHLSLQAKWSPKSNIRNMIIMDRLGLIGSSLEGIRKKWPTIHFSSSWKNWMYRKIIFIHQEIEELKGMDDLYIMAPEASEAIMSLFDLLDDFLHIVISLIKKEASHMEVESNFGKVLVLIRFVSVLNKMAS